MNTNIHEYELLDISFEMVYERPREEAFFVCEDSPLCNVSPLIEYDDQGVPMGTSTEEIKIRKQIIFDFYERWKDEHPDKCVFNKNLNADIFIRKESVVEAAGHAPKRYKSTLAVLRLDEVLANAIQVCTTNTKPGTRNQEKLTKMILMRYEFLDLGTIKLTVGVRRRSQDKVQYGITALEEGETIVPATNTKKKASHKK